MNEVNEIHLDTSFGNIHILQAGSQGKAIMAMHGDGASSSNFAWISCAKGIADKGYRFFSISMPGYGKSTGK